MANLFSDHVDALERSSAVEVPILDEIKKVLRSELRRRGILEYGPSLLGYLGKTWDDSEAMDDLAHDCYIRAIAKRLRGLRKCWKQSGDIEKLVRRNIRTFVGECQARCDPAGHAIFQNIKAAVTELSERGVLKRIDAANEPISGTAQFEVAGGKPGNFPEESGLKAALKQTGSIQDRLESQLRIGLAAQDQLAEAIRLLPNHNVSRFSVGTLKQAVTALLEEAGIRAKLGREVAFSGLKAEFVENIRTESRTSGYEEDVESYEQLVAAIRRAIDGLLRSAQVKARLRALLTHFSEAISSGDSDLRESLDELASRFGVPRSTLHDDFQSLRSLVSRIVKANREN